KQGEVFRGRWEAVRQPAKSTDAPKIAPSDTEMSALWDSIYGDGFYVANVLGTRLYGRGFLKTSNGDTLKVEFIGRKKPQMTQMLSAVPLKASEKTTKATSTRSRFPKAAGGCKFRTPSEPVRNLPLALYVVPTTVRERTLYSAPDRLLVKIVVGACPSRTLSQPRFGTFLVCQPLYFSTETF